MRKIERLMMLYTPLTRKAMELCFEAHAGQVDKSGFPYAHHPLHLAEQMSDEDAVCAALLHDVIEDCGKTFDDLRAIGMSGRTVEGVALLTHDDGSDYLDYVRRIAKNDIARAVKIADLRHNSDLTRLESLGDADLRRLRKYMEARAILGDLVYELETPAGPFSIEVNGEPYPFSAENITYGASRRYEIYEQGEGDVWNPTGLFGCADEVYGIKVGILPLKAGDRVEARFDFGGKITDQGPSEIGHYTVYEKGGYNLGLGMFFYDDEPGMYPYEICDFEGSYEILNDPVKYTTDPFFNTVDYCLAWRHGTTDLDADIVGWAVSVFPA